MLALSALTVTQITRKPKNPGGTTTDTAVSVLESSAPMRFVAVGPKAAATNCRAMQLHQSATKSVYNALRDWLFFAQTVEQGVLRDESLRFAETDRAALARNVMVSALGLTQ